MSLWTTIQQTIAKGYTVSLRQDEDGVVVLHVASNDFRPITSAHLYPAGLMYQAVDPEGMLGLDIKTCVDQIEERRRT